MSSGNTWPSLVASGTRAFAFILPVLALSASPGFRIHTIWVLSVGTTLGQLGLQQILLRRELALEAPVSP
ncbi:hypothetical protein WMF27_06200 [Sorangium sp. So ce281]|uniref:hypothetical protein n=1 Tax=unclassified Sorangium TaxID=2621164 RepID=UPI003F5FEF92